MKVLFLSAWYPNRYDAMEGLFVRKHAQAVARQGVEVHVLFVRQSDAVQEPEFACETIEGVHETVMYCPQTSSSWRETMNLKKAWAFWHSTYKTLPDIVHLNVITKNGWIARFLRYKYGIPYVITEHWTGYLPENGDYKGAFREMSSRWIAGGAERIMPVSKKLGEAMQGHGLKGKYMVLNNVVDDFFYDINPKESHDKVRFLHISCFTNRAKNTIGIVEAVARLVEKRTDFEVIMLGTGADYDITVEAADRYNLRSNGIMTFVGEQPPAMVKAYMDKSDIFLMFSNFENAPVVFTEALACGLPILTSKAGNAEVLVDEKRGRLVECRDVEGLARQMDYMIDHLQDFDSDTIRKGSEKFSYDYVGGVIVDVYSDLLKSK